MRIKGLTFELNEKFWMRYSQEVNVKKGSGSYVYAYILQKMKYQLEKPSTVKQTHKICRLFNINMSFYIKAKVLTIMF